MKNNREIAPAYFTSDKDEWATPTDLFEQLDNEFHFATDVCALPENAKCENYYSPADNGLAREWSGTCWCNPPYSEWEKWIRKAYEASLNGTTVVCLLASRTDTKAWHDLVMPSAAEIRFVKGRLKFGGSTNSAPFPSVVVVFSPRQYLHCDFAPTPVVSTLLPSRRPRKMRMAA